MSCSSLSEKSDDVPDDSLRMHCGRESANVFWKKANCHAMTKRTTRDNPHGPSSADHRFSADDLEEPYNYTLQETQRD